jgi:hypothetical protein
LPVTLQFVRVILTEGAHCLNTVAALAFGQRSLVWLIHVTTREPAKYRPAPSPVKSGQNSARAIRLRQGKNSPVAMFSETLVDEIETLPARASR